VISTFDTSTDPASSAAGYAGSGSTYDNSGTGACYDTGVGDGYDTGVGDGYDDSGYTASTCVRPGNC
jgi:hypothetical protein